MYKRTLFFSEVILIAGCILFLATATCLASSVTTSTTYVNGQPGTPKVTVNQGAIPPNMAAPIRPSSTMSLKATSIAKPSTQSLKANTSKGNSATVALKTASFGKSSAPALKVRTSKVSTVGRSLKSVVSTIGRAVTQIFKGGSASTSKPATQALKAGTSIGRPASGGLRSPGNLR